MAETGRPFSEIHNMQTGESGALSFVQKMQEVATKIVPWVVFASGFALATCLVVAVAG